MRVLLIGPTAVGKTATSLKLAQKLSAPIISADSRQCYKFMDIGTAKPDPNELDKAPHYNISIFTPNQKDSAADFYERTQRWEKEIFKHHEHILYVGGSTLYVQTVIQPLDDVPESCEKNVEELQQQMEQQGVESMYRKLREVDPEYAKRMDGMNPQRIIRALDVWKQTGKPFSSFHTRPDEIKPPPDTWVFGLHRPRKQLHQRINRRVDLMFQKGLIEEVRRLLDMGYNNDVKALKTVGYREVIEYLQNKRSFDSMLKDIKTRTRRYAKRQITWFRRWNFIHWIEMDDKIPEAAANEIFDYLKKQKLSHH